VTTVTEKEPITRFWTNISLIADIARILREKPAGRSSVLEVFELIERLVPFDAATLFLYNKKKDALDEVVSRGRTVNILNFLHFGMGTGLAGWAAEQKRTLVIPGHDPDSDSVQAHHDSIVILPLLVAGELIGVLCYSHRDKDAFDEHRRKLLEIVADHVAISLERIIHQKDLERKNQALSRALEELQEAQSHAIARDKLQAVSELAASVNHEINNPLSAIVGNAHMIEMEAAGVTPAVLDRVNAIVESARRISLVTHKLLKIDRLVSQNYPDDAAETMHDLDKSAGDKEC